MSNFIEDRLAIADLMTGWMYRDLAEWDKLGELFTPDGEIEITWFQGKASDFIAGSQRMGASDLKTKHVITSPVVDFKATLKNRRFRRRFAAEFLNARSATRLVQFSGPE
ncbi:nuclear transport factor 2 family protein, partial [Paraburkholderia sp.]|uniref:nuclear transport factor 2 family protein n=1 Tax=Paraburkholderia sp. TaxID=1926495 RepID=UPI002D67E72D